MILENFEAWVQRRQKQFAEHGYSVKSTRCGEEYDKPAARLDLESDTKLARITIWLTGECDLEVLDIESERTDLYQHHMIEENQNLDGPFQKFLQDLGMREG